MTPNPLPPFTTEGVTFSLSLETTGVETENGSGISGNSSSSDIGGSSGASVEEGWTLFRTIKLTVAFIVTILIIVNNLINLIVLPQMQDIGKRMKILLYSLSISDICLGLTVCLPALVAGTLGHWPFTPALCQLSGTMNGVGIGVSLWSLMAISIERYILVRKPLKSNKNQGMLYLGLGVSLIWTFSIVFYAFPILLEEDFQYYNYDDDVITCSFRWKSTVYFMVAKFMYPVLSGSIILSSSIMIHSALKKAMFDRLKWKAEIPTNSATTSAPKSPKWRLNFLPDKKSSQYSTQTENSCNAAANNTLTVNGSCEEHNGTTRDRNGSTTTHENGITSGIIGTRKSSPHLREEDTVMTRTMIHRNMKARLLVVLTSILFFTTTGPYMLTSLVAHFLPASHIPAEVKFASLWILNINSFINSYVYSFIYTEYRRRCRTLFRRLFFCKKYRSVNVADRNRSGNVDSGFQQGNTNSDSRMLSEKDWSKSGGLSRGKPKSNNGAFIIRPSVNTSHSSSTLVIPNDSTLRVPPPLVPRDDAFPSRMCASRDSKRTPLSGDRNSRSLLHPYYTVDINVVPFVDV